MKPEQQLLDGRRLGWFWRFLGRLGRRYWVARIDQVLSEAYHHELLINGAQRDLFDGRLKYSPNARKP